MDIDVEDPWSLGSVLESRIRQSEKMNVRAARATAQSDRKQREDQTRLSSSKLAKLRTPPSTGGVPKGSSHTGLEILGLRVL